MDLARSDQYMEKGDCLLYTSYNTEKVGSYVFANLAGYFGWAAQARNQEFKHMPAAQWVVEKKGTSSIAPISITNREFSDDSYKTSYQIPSDMQLFAVEGSACLLYTSRCV